jgi:hypothetical protein
MPATRLDRPASPQCVKAHPFLHEILCRIAHFHKPRSSLAGRHHNFSWKQPRLIRLECGVIGDVALVNKKIREFSPNTFLATTSLSSSLVVVIREIDFLGL